MRLLAEEHARCQEKSRDRCGEQTAAQRVMVQAQSRDQEPGARPDKPDPNGPCSEETPAHAALVRIRFQLHRLKTIVLDRARIWPEAAITTITRPGRSGISGIRSLESSIWLDDRPPRRAARSDAPCGAHRRQPQPPPR